eukprot:361497-Chlamydomonas_euryale.AAC.2
MGWRQQTCRPCSGVCVDSSGRGLLGSAGSRQSRPPCPANSTVQLLRHKRRQLLQQLLRRLLVAQVPAVRQHRERRVRQPSPQRVRTGRADHRIVLTRRQQQRQLPRSRQQPRQVIRRRICRSLPGHFHERQVPALHTHRRLVQRQYLRREALLVVPCAPVGHLTDLRTHQSAQDGAAEARVRQQLRQRRRAAAARQVGVQQRDSNNDRPPAAHRRAQRDLVLRQERGGRLRRGGARAEFRERGEAGVGQTVAEAWAGWGREAAHSDASNTAGDRQGSRVYRRRPRHADFLLRQALQAQHGRRCRSVRLRMRRRAGRGCCAVHVARRRRCHYCRLRACRHRSRARRRSGRRAVHAVER